MDRRTLTAISLCFLIYLGWQKYYLEPQMSARSAPAASSTAGAPPAGAGAVALSTTQQPANKAAASPRAPRPEQRVAIQTHGGDAVVGDSRLFFLDWSLRTYRKGLSADTAAIDLNTVTRQNGAMDLAFDDPSFAYLNSVQGELRPTADGAIWTFEDAAVRLQREFHASSQLPYVDVKVVAEFKGKRPNFAFVSLGSESVEKDPEAQDRQLLYWAGDAIERVPLKESIALKDIPTPVHYIGATNRYFLMALVGQSPLPATRGLVQPVAPYSARASLVYPITSNAVTLPLRAYFGPKELTALRSVDPKLALTVDFGWFTVIAYPILEFLKTLYSFTRNYGVAIILLTLLLKLVTYPLTYKSMKSMKEMARLQPQLQKIREKYKDDREALNREMLTLMRGHGYNPMAGCFPILIQMPVFFALYRVLYSSIELYHQPFAFWIHDLSSHDPLYVTPVLLSITMFLQQRLTPNTATDPAQQRMMQLMPLIFGAFMLALPSGLTLYMLVNALASIGQQVVLNRKFDSHAAVVLPASAQ